MAWIREHQLDWRLFFLALLVVGIIGPWFFDTIMVPAEYDCSPPNYRLRGDFCGSPLSGLWLMGGFVEFFRSLAVLLQPQAGETIPAQRLLAGLLPLAALLPLISTILVLLKPARKGAQIFTIAACGFAIGAGLLIGINSFPRLFWVVWGVWLFVLAAVGILACEAILLSGQKKYSAV